MTTGELPELDVTRIRSWCEQRVPERARHQVRMDCEVIGRTVTVIECRAPWNADAGAERTRRPIAQLTYHPSTSQWTLASFDQRGKALRSRQTAPTTTVADLLEIVERDPTGSFWG